MRRRKHNHARRKRQEKAGSSRTSTAPTAPPPPAGTARPTEASAAPTSRLALTPWWEKFPGRLEFEEQLLHEAGLKWERDEEEFERGTVVIRVWVEVGGDEVMLTAKFPDTYPYTRVEVFSNDLKLAHHQNPFERNLCLLGQASENWRVTDTLAGILQTQLELVVSTGTTEDVAEAEGLEERQGEPISSFYKYVADTAVIIDGGWKIDQDAESGTLQIGLIQRSPTSWLGAVLGVSDRDGKLLASIDPGIKALFQKTISGRWVRAREPIVENDPDRFEQALFEIDPSLRSPDWKQLNPAQSFDFFAIIQPEELEYRSISDGWVFLMRHRFKDGTFQKSGLFGFEKHLVRADRGGASDIVSRIPELAALGDRKIALVGAGCIGAPSAIQFARGCVGELRLLDGDTVHVGPTVRWPLGFSVAGTSKVDALADFIGKNHPYTRVVPHRHRIGTSMNERRDREVLAELYQGADLIFDASAEVGIQYLLADLAHEYEVPYICISTTPGGWGGIVARIRPGATGGCWGCLQHSLNDGTIPSPPHDGKQPFQPMGCGTPTFLGASFDVEEVSLAGVRLAVSTLSGGAAGGYPLADWDVAVIKLRDDLGNLITPSIETFPLDRNPSCRNHGT